MSRIAVGGIVTGLLSLFFVLLSYIYLRWIPFSPLSTLLPVFYGLLWLKRGRRRRWRMLGLTIVLCPVLDFTWRPYFLAQDDLVYARIGGIDHRSARLSYRGLAESLVLISASGTHRNFDINIEDHTDEVRTLVIDDLSPDTWYNYHLKGINVQGTFKTFIDPALDQGSLFSFGTSSCVKPNFPYVPFRDALTLPGFDIFAKEELGTGDGLLGLPRFLLFLGDFIYADVPYYFGEKLYRQLYRQIYASPSYKKIYSKIPTLHIYDDHEVMNNWSSNSSKPFPAAFEAYQTFNGFANPLRSQNESWYSFQVGKAASFFVMDTRRYRDREEVEDGPEKSMLGQQQLAELFAWAALVNQTAVFKFIVSSVPYTDLWRGFDGHLDTWAGYTYERQLINNLFRYVPNVIVLSGDRHEFAATAIGTPRQWSSDGQPGIGDVGMVEFSTSPMSQFYLPIRTYIEELGAPHSKLGSGDVPLKYVQKGNVKYTMFEIDTRNASRMTATAIFKVDGKECWRKELVARPLLAPTSVGRPNYSIFDLYRFALRFFV